MMAGQLRDDEDIQFKISENTCKKKKEIEERRLMIIRGGPEEHVSLLEV